VSIWFGALYIWNCLIGDYINSKEYRKPDWLIKMEEIKERLAGEHTSFIAHGNVGDLKKFS
jgi:hypothetical protein